jgi:ATP-binding cassette subfamily B protein
MQKSLKNLGFHRSSLGFTVELFRAGSTIFILVYGAMMVFTSGMLIGQVVACYYLLSQMTPALLRVGETSVTLREASIAWKRLADIWMIPTEKRRAGRPFKYFDQLKLIDGTFRWNNYHHLWGGIGISISRGMLVALTGPSGSGKTTLLQVLHRKYEPSGGMLLLDEQPARAYQLCEYRRRITLVPQQIHIFKTSLADNILLGRPSWYLNDLLKKFPFRDWLQRFNQGLATILGDGNRVLSGGEKQMIGLLRALYARPDILLIDESMNALDHETRERLIYSLKLFALNGGVLLCTHDRTVLSKMDQIYVLANGRIIRSSHPATRPYDHHEAEHRISENRRVL